ncbi:MAG: hypothetical protein CL593_06125 [Alteromonas sp.]|uniref:hypothetical protein n=1 Tax=Alteromonas australica TaxID=589873 RepID=UPI000C6C187F|nr:hypothetical protein [Alteromonas australica]MAB92913.1 hypothetical protein [Alteromonas sp.]|tara:strand:- start:125 stop:1351 length:1227 start_codon:yes stop_codon:yes gene_type:complete
MNIKKTVFYMLCFLLPFENTALATLGGVFTAPLGIILVPIMLLLILADIRKLPALDLSVIKFFFLTLGLSFVSLIFFLEFETGFLIDRGSRFILIVIPTFTVFLFTMRQPLQTITTGAFILCCMIFLIYIVNLVSPTVVNIPSFLQHTAAFSPHRMRGFTLEASTFAFQFVLACLLFSHIKKVRPFYSFIAICLLTFLTTSKGGVLSFILAFFLAYIICLFRVSTRIKYVSSALLIPLILLASQDSIAAMFATDIQKYTSVATRSTISLTAIVSLFHYPIGAGYFGFLPSIYNCGPIAMEILDYFFPNTFNYSEVMKYFVVGQVKGVGTKTFLMDWLIIGGMVFLYFYVKAIRYFVNELNKKKDFYLYVMFLFVVVSTSFYIPADGHYIAPLVVAYLMKNLCENEKAS